MRTYQTTRMWIIIGSICALAAAAVIPQGAGASLFDWRPPQPRQPDQIGFACILILNPVCGIDGLTYSNSCFAQRSGVPIAHPGPCGSRNRPDPTPRPRPQFQPPAAKRSQAAPAACPHCPNCVSSIGICPDPSRMHYSPDRLRGTGSR